MHLERGDPTWLSDIRKARFNRYPNDNAPDVPDVSDMSVPIDMRLEQLGVQLQQGHMVSPPMQAYYLVAEARTKLEMLESRRTMDALVYLAGGFALSCLITLAGIVVLL